MGSTSGTVGSLSNHDGNGNENINFYSGRQWQLHMRFYISMQFSAKERREMIKLKVSWRTWTHDSEFTFFYLNLRTILTDSAPG